MAEKMISTLPKTGSLTSREYGDVANGSMIHAAEIIENPGETLLSAEEVARGLGTPVRTLRRQLERGELPGQKLGRNWVLPAAQLISVLNGRCETLTPEIVAGEVGIHPKTVRKALETGRLPGQMHLGRWQMRGIDVLRGLRALHRWLPREEPKGGATI